MSSMDINQFDYNLPARAIAQSPLEKRSDSRLLYMHGGALTDARFYQLPQLLLPGDVVVLNDTRVLAARFYGRKDSGGRVEILLERVESARVALALMRGAKKVRRGQTIYLDDGARLCIESRVRDLYRVRLISGADDFYQLAAQCGSVPLPPYIRRAPSPEDSTRYQTVYARTPGAVAAPTAGLHVDEALLAKLSARDIAHCFITLHVGAGTFQPVRVADARLHTMHAEKFIIEQHACDVINRARHEQRRIVAIGTTVARALESAVRIAAENNDHGDANNVHDLNPMQDDTRLFIYPGFKFRAVQLLVTNFHVPRSTLLMLVCAFGDVHRVMTAYQHALARGYRFYSYGDAMLIEPENK